MRTTRLLVINRGLRASTARPYGVAQNRRFVRRGDVGRGWWVVECPRLRRARRYAAWRQSRAPTPTVCSLFHCRGDHRSPVGYATPFPKTMRLLSYPRLPLRRARRVKKICRWHIFSPSGKQAMLATRAEGCRGATEGECRLGGYLSLHREQVAVPLPPQR